MSEPSKEAIDWSAECSIPPIGMDLGTTAHRDHCIWAIQSAIDQACAAKDSEIAALKDRCLTKDASIEAFDTRNEQLVERIAAMEALLERSFHFNAEWRLIEDDEPCRPDCPACAWERMKKEVR